MKIELNSKYKQNVKKMPKDSKASLDFIVQQFFLFYLNPFCAI